jgi:D-aspartate ligase
MSGERRRAPVLDAAVPLALIKIGAYPLDHGGLFAVRSMGRAGVPVYAMTEGRFTPTALSRYLTRAIPATASVDDDADGLLAIIGEVGRRIGRPAIALPTDDEAAVFMAEHREALATWFIAPAVPPDLPRRLASKRRLFELGRHADIPVPEAAFPVSLEEVVAFADHAMFPIVAKNDAPWVRWTAPAVSSSTLVASPDELITLARAWTFPANVILQEYIPQSPHGDWIFHGYFDDSAACALGFTAVKYRSWPPAFGVTTYARTQPNDALAGLAATFGTRIGYRGVCDMDWRFDPRDRRYKLLDFNPRVGANVGLFTTEAGIDLVRAMHLDLTGRVIPAGRQRDERTLVVEHLDLPSRLRTRGVRGARRPDGVPGTTEFAWMSRDDPMPVAGMSLLAGRVAAAKIGGRLRRG